jgi:hypothetical protein
MELSALCPILREELMNHTYVANGVDSTTIKITKLGNSESSQVGKCIYAECPPL